MANYNKVIMAGNLMRDPQMSYLPSQTPVVEFGLAINRNWTGQDGQKREETCFVDCRCYGKQAEIFNQYMAKGRSVLIEGRLELDTWEGKDGTRRSKHRILVERFQFLGSGGGGQGQGKPAPARQAPAAAEPPAGDQFQEPAPPDLDEPQGDDIPF